MGRVEDVSAWAGRALGLWACRFLGGGGSNFSRIASGGFEREVCGKLGERTDPVELHRGGHLAEDRPSLHRARRTAYADPKSCYTAYLLRRVGFPILGG